MKNKDLIELLNGISALDRFSGVKLCYALNRNRRVLAPIVEDLKKSVVLSDEYKKYHNKRIKMCQAHAMKDEKGQPLCDEIGNFIIDSMDKFNVEHDLLVHEYKKCIDENKDIMEEYAKVLEEEAEVRVYKIAASILPDSITSIQMNGIFELIEADD